MENQLLPTVLITGFPPFPGARVNPTQWLIKNIDPIDFKEVCRLRTGILPVDYGKAGETLDDLARKAQPDIVINFGLAADSSGIRLERIARNEIAPNRPDNAGIVPQTASICDGSLEYASGLPLEEIAEKLHEANLPVQWSDNAGGYLCNYVFYLGRAGLCPAVTTQFTGFVHVPSLADVTSIHPDGKMTISKADLMRAAEIVICETVSSWHEKKRRLTPVCMNA